jgi:AraC-like DNA-binding protein
MQEDFRYLPVSRRDRQWGLYVTGAGLVLHGETGWDAAAHPPPYYYQWAKGRALPEYYMALYHPHSSLEFESETTKTIVPPGNFVVLCPGVWHRYRPVKETAWTQYWMCFGGAYADHLMKEGFLSREQPVFQVGMDVRLLSPFRRLLDRLRSSQLGLHQLMAAGVTEILGIALALSRSGCSGDLKETLVHQAKGVLEQRIEENVDMGELASSLGIGYDQFRHAFKQLTGFAPYQYHLQLRIGRAKRLLAETGLSIKEIAHNLKFDDSYHFSKMFKQHAGMSPTHWRADAYTRDGKKVISKLV